MATGDQNLSVLYTDLNRLGQKQEYEKALKVANKILISSPGEELAFQCKIVSLIQLNKFDDALTSIRKNQQLNKKLQFEKAYCEYRLNRTKEALTTLRSCQQPDLKTKELLAQVLYRLEEFEECSTLYRDVVKNSHDDFDEERETNLAAVLACMKLWRNNDMPEPNLRLDTYELCYNRACFLIGQGELRKAEEMLSRADKLCRASLEEDQDTTEDDIESELGVIRVQLAYLKQQLGKPEEALQLYNQVLKRKPTDIGLVAVASNNVVTINKEQNVFDSKKKIKQATADGVNHKLGLKQREVISLNQCLLHLYTNQSEQCRRIAAKLRNDKPGLESAVLIEAAMHVREKHIHKAIELLNSYLKTNKSSVNVRLTLAQLQLSNGAVQLACDLLQSLGDISHKPGIVSALVSLYQSQEDPTSVTQTLTKAIAWYNKQQPKSPDLVPITRACANHFMKIGNYTQAAVLLEQLRKLDNKDPRIIAMLITAYTQTDPSKAQIISKDLPSVEDLASSVDVDNLETSFIVSGPKYRKLAKDTPPTPTADGDVPMAELKKKKKKKTKLPKNYNPDAALDPERWLPKQERSYYRGKRRDKRKGADIGRGTQGSASGNVGDLMSETKPTPKSPIEQTSPAPSSPSTSATTPSSSGPRANKPAQAAGKKRKKKGGK